MTITFEKVRDVLAILATALSGLIVWAISKRHPSKQDKLDYEAKLFDLLQDISERYAGMHKTIYDMQETIVEIETQNKALIAEVKDLTEKNGQLQESIEHLTKENGKLKSIVMNFSSAQSIKN